MEKVLIIANLFPPIGGSGVQRSVKFVKYLRNYGYDPVVLTRKTDSSRVNDETLLKDIPDSVLVYRTRACEFAELKGIFYIFGKIISKLMIPDGQYLWSRLARRTAIDIIKKYNIKKVYTTSTPYSAHLLGLYIKNKLPDIKLVVDFRDEWTNNPYILDKPYNKIRMGIERRMERKVLNTADFIIANTPVMKDNFLKNNNMEDEKFYVIPNGYDEEDFLGYDKKSVKNKKFTMVYTGSLYGRRKPDTFFEALKQLLEENKIDRNKICVKLIGNYHNDKLQTLIDSYNLTKQIEILGYVSHDVCIKYQMECDSLVLIEGSGRGGNAFYTGKIFEYMNTGKPVLALLPDGVAADLIREANIGLVANTDDIKQIKENMIKYYEMWEKGKLIIKPVKNVIKQYERKKLTEKLALVFNGLDDGGK